MFLSVVIVTKESVCLSLVQNAQIFFSIEVDLNSANLMNVATRALPLQGNVDQGGSILVTCLFG